MRHVPAWKVAGLEFNPVAVEYARQVRGLDVYTGELPQLDWPAATYDVITMWHVLEHLPDPIRVLAEVRRLLRPDGLFIVAVPMRDSAEAQFFGPTWAGYDVPRHLITFTRLSLTQLLTQAGFRVEEHFGVIQGFASVRLSLRWWLVEKGFRGPLMHWLSAALLPFLFVYFRWRSGKKLGVATMVARL